MMITSTDRPELRCEPACGLCDTIVPPAPEALNVKA
jgi:hypothetical protein